jgi:hypothetical protein
MSSINQVSQISQTDSSGVTTITSTVTSNGQKVSSQQEVISQAPQPQNLHRNPSQNIEKLRHEGQVDQQSADNRAPDTKSASDSNSNPANNTLDVRA